MKKVLSSITILALLLLSGCRGQPNIDPARILPAWDAVLLSENIYTGRVASIDPASYVKFGRGEGEPGWNFISATVRVEEALKGDVPAGSDIPAELPARYLDWVEEGQTYLFFAVPVPEDYETVPIGYMEDNPWWAVRIADSGALENPDWDRLASEGYAHDPPPASVEDVREIIRIQAEQAAAGNL